MACVFHYRADDGTHRPCRDPHGGYRWRGWETCLPHLQRLRATEHPEEPERDERAGLPCAKCSRVRPLAAYTRRSRVCARCRGTAGDEVSAATGGAARVLAVLWASADARGRVEMTVVEIAGAVGISERKTRAAVRRLEAAGDVRRVQEGRGRGRTPAWALVRRTRAENRTQGHVSARAIARRLRALEESLRFGLRGPSGAADEIGALRAEVEKGDA